MGMLGGGPFWHCRLHLAEGLLSLFAVVLSGIQRHGKLIPRYPSSCQPRGGEEWQSGS